jgi:sugar lactone lactonase YvrE
MLAFVASAQGSSTALNVQVSVLTAFPVAGEPFAAAATNNGDVVALAGPHVVAVNPNGKQNPYPVTISGGALAGPLGAAYDNNHQLYVAVLGSFGPLPSGAPGLFKVSPNGKAATPVPGSEGMIGADGLGLDASTNNVYATDIFGSAIWRITPDGTAHLWTSSATNPLLVLPDGVKVFQNAVYASINSGKILRIPIKPDGTAGTAQVWAQVPGAIFDDMVLDDRTGDVYVSRLNTNDLLRITPAGAVTTIASNADGLLGAANMTLIHVGHSTVIYLGNTTVDFFGTGQTTPLPPSLLKITIN